MPRLRYQLERARNSLPRRSENHSSLKILTGKNVIGKFAGQVPQAQEESGRNTVSGRAAAQGRRHKRGIRETTRSLKAFWGEFIHITHIPVGHQAICLYQVMQTTQETLQRSQRGIISGMNSTGLSGRSLRCQISWENGLWDPQDPIWSY